MTVLRKIGTGLRKLTLAVASAAALTMGAAPAHAGVIQLGFILDGSGSIGASNWTTIVHGLSGAVNTLIPVSGANSYEISVVTFDNNAHIAVNSVMVTSVATRTALANTISNLSYSGLGGSTNYSAAFDAMRIALTDGIGTTAANDLKSYVNFATDGAPNTGGTNGNGEFAVARTALINAGIDNISVEGISLSVGGTDENRLKTQVCYPTPCDSVSPYDFPVHGFYIPVATVAQYEAAIQNKIQIVVDAPLTDVPEPATLALLGVGLAAVGMRRRARKA